MNFENLEASRDYLGLVVACPFCPPDNCNPEHAKPLGVFIETEVGRQALTPLIDKANELRQEGMETESAISEAFGSAAVRDEENNPKKVDLEEVERAKSEFSLEETIKVHEAIEGSRLTADAVKEDQIKDDESDTEPPFIGGGPDGSFDEETLLRGRQIRETRLQRGLSPEMAAARAGLDLGRYSSIEEGTAQISPEEYYQIISALSANDSKEN